MRPSPLWRTAAQYPGERQRAAEDFLAARHAPPFGPFEPLPYTSQVMGAGVT